MLLVPWVENKTSATIFQPNLKQALLNIGQDDEHCPVVHAWESHSMVLNRQVITHKATYFPPSSNWGTHTSWHTSCRHFFHLHVIKYILCSWGNHACLQEWKHVAYYPIWTTALSIPGSYLSLSKWGLQVSGILFYRSKHSNLNLKHNFSHYKAGQEDIVSPCLKKTQQEQERWLSDWEHWLLLDRIWVQCP